ncbi:RICIN domain-containing protein [Streptomyces sp. NPDC002402]
MDPAGHGAPDPEQAHSSAEFVASMQALKDWSGLTYRELTARAEAVGDVLPRSTVANMLGRSTVPREELVAAFVRACGCGPGAAETWLRVRKELSRRERQSDEVPRYDTVATETEAGQHGVGEPEPGPGTMAPTPPGPPRRPWRARVVLLAAVVALGAIALAVTLTVRDSDDPRDEPQGVRKETFLPSGRPPEGVPLRIRAVHSGLCLAEDGSQNGQLRQQPCAPGTIPRFNLRAVEPAWRIVTFHKKFGWGCSGVQEESMEVGAPLEDQECGKRGPAEAFRLEPVGKPVRGYRLRPLHSDLCAGVAEAATKPGAELRQLTCTKDMKGQLFAFDRESGTP